MNVFTRDNRTRDSLVCDSLDEQFVCVKPEGKASKTWFRKHRVNHTDYIRMDGRWYAVGACNLYGPIPEDER